MIRNYFLIAFRLLLKNKAFSAINISGLSIGMACCILIGLYIQDEIRYEKGFHDHEKIFRINTTNKKDEVVQYSIPYTSPPIAMELARTLPEIEMATRVMRPRNVEQHVVLYKDKSFFESDVYLVDSTFFEMFSYTLLEGDPATVLDGPSTVVISERLKEKVFRGANAIDELLTINSGESADTFRITGVVARNDFPSHLDADIYMCMNSNGYGQWLLQETTWANNNVVGGYLKLRDKSDAKSVEGKMPQQLELHAGEDLRRSGRQKVLSLQPIADIRLYSDVRVDDNSPHASGSITYVYVIATIGLMILLMACINFMNLTTAKAAQRAGEIGIRKSMGASRINLIRQFLGESVIIVIFALLLSFVLVVLALPLFNQIMQKEMGINMINLPIIIFGCLIIALVTALLAGCYPAFYLSSLKPTQVLKSKSLTGNGSQWLRKSLVVLQFVVTITLISSIVIILGQLKYIRSKSLGFDAKQVIVIPLRTGLALQQYESLSNAFRQVPGVNLVSGTTSVPSTPLFRDWNVFKEGSTNEKSMRHEIVFVDEGYFKMLDIDLLEGRDFDVRMDNLAADTSNISRVIVNEASLRVHQIPIDQAIGSSLIFEPDRGVRYIFNIIGVVKDFHQFSLHKKISPMMFILPSERTQFPYIAASVNMNAYQQVIAGMGAEWQKRINNAPFESIFLDDNIKKLYESEARTSSMITISTIIAIVISSMGLYGLSVFVAERRTKEIGVRKVVGASVESIVGMLSREYVKLIVISFAISIPVGYWLATQWLQSFEYRIEPGVTVFLVSGLISFAIAWITISFESFRAATKNPVETLRSS